MFEFWPIYLVTVTLGVLCGFFWSLIIIARAYDRVVDTEIKAHTLTPTERQQ